MSADGICRHAGAESRSVCVWCNLDDRVKQIADMRAVGDHLLANLQAYYVQVEQLKAERDQLITSLRSIEASLGTMDHSAAIEDEKALPEYVSTKVAQLVSQDLRLSASLLKELESGDHLTEQLDASKEKLNTFITSLRELRKQISENLTFDPDSYDPWDRGYAVAKEDALSLIDKLLPAELPKGHGWITGTADMDAIEGAAYRAVEPKPDSEPTEKNEKETI